MSNPYSTSKPIDNRDSVAIDRSTTFPVEIERQSRDQMEVGAVQQDQRLAGKQDSIIRDEERKLRQRAKGVNPLFWTLTNGGIHQSIHQRLAAISWAWLLLRFVSTVIHTSKKLKSISTLITSQKYSTIHKAHFHFHRQSLISPIFTIQLAV